MPDPVAKSLTEEQKGAIAQLKERLNDVTLENDGLLEDRRLVNWLQARDFRINETEVLFRKHLEWRTENKIDSILTSHSIPMEDPMVGNLAADIIGSDKDGNTILVVMSGQIEMKRIVQTYGKDISMQIGYYMLETAYADIIARSSDANCLKSAVYIVDLDGFRFKEFMSSDVLDVVISSLKSVENNYPNLLSKAFILNAPFIFPVIWNVLKPFMSQNTLGKVSVVGQSLDKIRSCLLEYIPLDQIPPKWGGTGYSERIPSLNVSPRSASSSKTDLAAINDMMTETLIPAGETFELTFEVQTPKAVLSWSFKPKQHDIGFSTIYKKFSPNNSESLEEEVQVEYCRFTANKGVQSGTLICDKSGYFIVRFDNSYSRLREKRLIHHVELARVPTDDSLDKIQSEN